MSNLAVSFASLVKSNNGMFKSEAQAKFLLSQCQEENTFFVGGQVYNNSYTLSYNCDSLGVVSVEKYLPKSGKTTTTWERQPVEQLRAKQAEDAARREREINREAASIAKFQARQDAFQVALVTAKTFIFNQMIASGTPEAISQRAVDMILKNQDGITAMMTDLVKSPEFVKAWEVYNNEPGV